MAIQKRPPFQDMPLSEIQKRAKGVNLDRDYFARQQQPVRADAVRADHAAARAAERSALESLAAKLTPAAFREAIAEYSTAVGAGAGVDEVLAILARADAATKISGDGLIETITRDRTGREISTFRSIDGRKHWMDPHRGLAGLQIALTNNTENTRKQAQRYLAAHPEAEPV